MLTDIFETTASLARHRATIFSRYLDEYVAHLRAMGYGPVMARRCVQHVTSFGEFLARRRVRKVSEIGPAAVSAFARFGRRLPSRARGRAYGATEYTLTKFLHHLHEQGVAVAQRRPAVDPFHGLARSLKEDVGLRPSTIVQCCHFARLLLRHLHHDGSRAAWCHLKISDIDGFIMTAGRRYSRRSMRTVCTSIRTLLRHLFRQGVVAHDLAPSVLMPRIYAQERIPCALPWSQVHKIVRAATTNSPMGRRDRAILVLLATYGVRPGEIVQLRLSDIDWRANTIRFRRSKVGRDLAFPLTTQAGEAITRYLRSGRPTTGAREVFVRTHAPYVALARGSAVSLIVRRYLRAAGVGGERRGAYVIRHSLAVHLIRRRQPLKLISDMLGHRDPDVAFEYTKLALEDLHGVALSAQEVLP
jgi:integrase/recombinase XerD